MNGSILSDKLLRRVSLALLGALLLSCSGEEGELGPVLQAIWPDTDLVAVALTDEGHAIVVSMTGEIYRTTDAGDSWRRSVLPAVSSLRALSMGDGERGWVVGDGAILRTDDGGLRWRRQRLPGQSASMRLVAVSAIDAAHALVVGENGIVLRTGDSGGSWQGIAASRALQFDAPGLRNDLFCLGDLEGRCWSAGHGLERTGSDGEGWEVQVLEDYSAMPPIHFDRGQVELAGSDAARLQEFVASNRQRMNLIWIVEPGVGSRELEAVGRRRDPSALFDLITARLQEVRTVIEEGYVSPDRILVLGEPPWDYEDYLDEDAHFLERYWEERLAVDSQLRIRVRDQLLLESVRVEDSGLGLAVGESGAVVRSDDGGDHWQTVPRPTPYDLHAVGIGSRRAVAVGAQGGLWTSEDAGRHWQSSGVDAESGFFDSLRAISFSPSGRVGLVVGEKGRILRSLDGGETWTELSPG